MVFAVLFPWSLFTWGQSIVFQYSGIFRGVTTPLEHLTTRLMWLLWFLLRTNPLNNYWAICTDLHLYQLIKITLTYLKDGARKQQSCDLIGLRERKPFSWTWALCVTTCPGLWYCFRELGELSTAVTMVLQRLYWDSWYLHSLALSLW